VECAAADRAGSMGWRCEILEPARGRLACRASDWDFSFRGGSVLGKQRAWWRPRDGAGVGARGRPAGGLRRAARSVGGWPGLKLLKLQLESVGISPPHGAEAWDFREFHELKNANVTLKKANDEKYAAMETQKQEIEKLSSST
jgi:hypothetical protein